MNIVNPQTAIPSDLIGYFPSSCPSGWAEYTGARGRYIVGTPSGGDMAGTVGTAMTNKESRVSGQHTHTFSGNALASHNHTFSGAAASHNHAFSGDALGTHNHVQNAHGHNINVKDDASASNTHLTGGYNTPRSVANIVVDATATNIAISAGTPAGTNAAAALTPAGSNGAVTAGTPAGTNANTGSVANTNAPYIQLICCKKN